MPAEIVTLAWCADYESAFRVPGSNGAEYTVYATMAGLQMVCECKAWKFAPLDDKQCKHTRLVWREACFYNPQWKDGGTREITPVDTTKNTVPDDKCPACGGPTINVRCAV